VKRKRDIRVEFERIAEQAVRSAERIECPKEQFIEGLETIETYVREMREMHTGVR
jgi:hypothetical protein